MAETNCDICLTDETLTFINIANTTTTSKKFKIEAIGHDRIYACLDSDPSATFVNNVYSTCLAPYPSECFGATNYVILKNFESFYKENNMSYYINLSINGVGSEIDPCSNIIDQINLNYIDIVEAKYQLDESNQPNNISLRNLTNEVLKIIVERGEEVDCNCPGATNVAILNGDSDYVIYGAITSVEINDVVYQRNYKSEQGFDSLPVGIEISHIRTPDYNYILKFTNNTQEFLKFKVNNYTTGYYEVEQSNQTLNYVRQGVDEAENEYGYVTFCLAPGSGISCEGAINSITLELFHPIIGDTENTVIVTVKKGSEIRNHEFQYVDDRYIFDHFWNSYFNNWVELLNSDSVTFSNKIAEHVEVSIQSARLLNPPYPNQSEEVNPTFKIIDGVMSFCLSKRLDE